VPIASWGLDDLIVQQVAEALSIRFQVQPITYPRATFATTQESAITAVNLVRGDPFKKLVQTEVSPQALDAYTCQFVTRGMCITFPSCRRPLSATIH
jgi:hypothetical protein